MEEKKINGRKHVQIECAHTGDLFWKDKSEYTRRIKQNSNYLFYKNLKAKAAAAGKNGYSHLIPWIGVASDNFIKSADNAKDKYSPFRYFISKAKQRKKDKSNLAKFQQFDITLEFLLDLWEAQNGICPYSKLKMKLPPTLAHNRNDPLCASLDRIDPNIGYMQKNVEFVTQFVNLGKNKYPADVVSEYFSKIFKLDQA